MKSTAFISIKKLWPGLCLSIVLISACGVLGNVGNSEVSVNETAVVPTNPPLPTATIPLEATADTEGTGVINGRVWHDVCVNQGDSPDGCLTNSDNTYQANGVLDDDETGLAEVLVRLGSGECPNITTNAGTVLGMSETAVANTTTDANGDYLFVGLPAGIYCLMINTLDEPNRNLLLPGIWTGESKGLETIDLAADETHTTDFGWDYEFKPVSAAALNCRDSAEFVEDVTIPDDTIIAAGDLFTKTWRIRNVGTCDWTPAYALAFVDGYDFSGVKTIPITNAIVPTNTVDFTIALHAPTITGTFRADWQIYNANKRDYFGVFGDEPIWVQIVVEEPVPTAELTPTISVTTTTPTVITGTVIGTPTFQDAAIRGLVWQDNDANGLQSDAEEPLRGITIAVYRDECSTSQPLATRITNLSGEYVFTNLAPGTYCVSVDAETPENISLLSPGKWVYPETTIGRTTVTLQSGANITEINFGWQFEEE